MTAGWTTLDAPPPLARDAVHVWLAPVDSARAAACAPLLNAEEQQRAALFRFAADRERYTIGRGTLRRLLGSYLAQPPAALTFSLGPAGKPALAGPEAGSGLQFNVSHSGSAVLLGFAWSSDLGVDVEAHRPNVEFADLATRFYAPDEAALVLHASPAERAAVFYAIWTRKEACVKAIGTGIGIDLRGFSVAPLRPEPLTLPIHDRTASRTLIVQPLPSLPGHDTALAIECARAPAVSCLTLRN